ncbi:MAG: PDZ domain-containing protein [bacterium]|nr:PDZ domain-containing protein [bacterium]
MKPSRSALLAASTLLVLFLVVGGLAVKVGAAENSYSQSVLFAEVLELVLRNYVDPVEAEGLLEGAYEGMLAALDPNGAYLSAEEVEQWRKDAGSADPGIVVLKAGRMLEIVSVRSGSSAEESGLQIGDQIRSVGERLVRDMSMPQSRLALRGRAGSTVMLDVLSPSDGFRPKQVEVIRSEPTQSPFELERRGSTAVLRLRRLSDLPLDDLSGQLTDAREAGAERLLVDVRSLADSEPREAASLAGRFMDGTLLRLRDRSGRLVESLDSESDGEIWSGPVAVLVNGATAGGGEALALLLRSGSDAVVFGEKTYGLGAEARLYELENGAALLISSALWETGDGTNWNAEGIEPDREVRGEGESQDEMDQDQLSRVLEMLDEGEASAEGERKAA